MQPVRRRFPHRSRERLRRLVAGTIIAAAALTAPLDACGGAEPTEAAENEIRTAIENWRSAFNARDEDRVCALFAPDLVANYQHEPERDYASLCEVLRMALRDPDTAYRYSVEINEIMVDGDAAVVRLIWALEIDKAGSPTRTIEEPAVDILHRQADGSWKISRYLAYPPAR
ncbi:MAG TPA: SgcJ/EcaC family oxidoreductase [Stellaceae bacterium]|nr:SgcJ/EcaC family oxidoreductase [Stellaceae bacterium]